MLPSAFKMMASTLIPEITWLTIFNLSGMQGKQSDANENYAHQPSKKSTY